MPIIKPRVPVSTEYILRKRKGQKRMSLSVHESGRVTLTIPKWVSRIHADRFFKEQRDWVQRALARIAVVGRPSRAAQRASYLKHKEEARLFVTERLAVLNTYYGYDYKRISIRMNASRWGSCSARGNLNFDFRIVFLPPAVQDYLLVHELCHLKEMNHSPRFWKLVAEVIPEYKACRRELCRHRL